MLKAIRNLFKKEEDTPIVQVASHTPPQTSNNEGSRKERKIWLSIGTNEKEATVNGAIVVTTYKSKMNNDSL